MDNPNSVLVVEWDGAIDIIHFTFPFSSSISLDNEHQANISFSCGQCKLVFNNLGPGLRLCGESCLITLKNTLNLLLRYWTNYSILVARHFLILKTDHNSMDQ